MKTDSLTQYVLDACINPPIDERAREAAKDFDASAFDGYDHRRDCTFAQRERTRDFLRRTGLEFDDHEWAEFLSRADLQSMLSAAIFPGVVSAKNAPVTVALSKIRSRIEFAAKEPPVPFVDEKPAEPTPQSKTAPTPPDEAAVREATDIAAAANVDWNGIASDDLEGAKAALIAHIARTTPEHRAWYRNKAHLGFVPHGKRVNMEGAAMQPFLGYRIRETNGRTCYFDGIFRQGNTWYVGPLPAGLIGEEPDEAA